MLANRSIPTSTVIPTLAYADVPEAAAWLVAAFGFTVRLTIADHRIQLNIGDGAMVVTELREGDVAAGHGVMVRLEEIDAHFARAQAHGARVIHPLTDYPYGERQYTVEDLGGHRWVFSRTLVDTAPEDWGGVSGAL